MVNIELCVIEEKISEVLQELNEEMEADVMVSKTLRPGEFFKSIVLVTAINRVADALDIAIPENCYIFFDKKEHRQLSVAEAALKVREHSRKKKIKDVVYGK